MKPTISSANDQLAVTQKARAGALRIRCVVVRHVKRQNIPHRVVCAELTVRLLMHSPVSERRKKVTAV